jgi:hypothetical protein
MSVVILAPSGAGKSTAIQRYKPSGRIFALTGVMSDRLDSMGHYSVSQATINGRTVDLVDGDTIVAKLIGWPKEKRWWDNPTIKGAFIPRAIRAIQQFVQANADTVVLTEAHGEPAANWGSHVCVVLPGGPVIEAQRAKRATEREAKGLVPKGDGPWSPTEDSKWERIRGTVPEFPDFKAAVDWAARQDR